MSLLTTMRQYPDDFAVFGGIITGLLFILVLLILWWSKKDVRRKKR